MFTEDQAPVIDFLSSPAAHGGLPVERIDTHASIVFLAGSCAWKLKRAVLYDYLDFSTADRRRACCEAEVRLNRRTAPSLYAGVVAVTREADGSLALGGHGTPVDWLVSMHRFDQNALFDRLAARGALDFDLMPRLGEGIARFHHAADPRPDHGGHAGMKWVVDGNGAGFDEFGPGILDPAACASLTLDADTALDRLSGLLDRRRQAGYVRQCHGDLHLGNIVLLDGRPTLFDAVEFNDEIACTDVLYDLAFLLMDLWHRGLHRHANAVWNAYLGESADVAARGPSGLEGMALLPLFLSCRAAVRAKITATMATLEAGSPHRLEHERAAREYLQLASQLLRPAAPVLMAIGGLSGSGKSTLASRVAPDVGAVPGAVVLRSDEIRKRLAGVPPLARLGGEGYTPEMSHRVYATAAERASTIVRSGHAAIVDAVFARPADRAAIEAVAAEASVPFVGIWLDAPIDTLIARSRLRRFDASDADDNVIRAQRAQDTGPIAWHRIDATPEPDVVLRHVREIFRGGGKDLLPRSLEHA